MKLSINAHVGQRVRQRRWAVGITLQQLGGLGRWAARTSACALGITVASMVAAQNVYGQDRINHKNFKLAPNLPEAEAAAEATEKVFYVLLITGSLAAAWVILFFWFVLGPGRKSKFTQD